MAALACSILADRDCWMPGRWLLSWPEVCPSRHALRAAASEAGGSSELDAEVDDGEGVAGSEFEASGVDRASLSCCTRSSAKSLQSPDLSKPADVWLWYMQSMSGPR